MTTTESDAILSSLRNFNGTEAYHRWSVLFPDVLTDGAKYLAEKAGMFWLMDIVGSVRAKILKEGFGNVKLTLTPSKPHAAEVTIDDGNGRVFYKQNIQYTDCPFPSIGLFAAPMGERLVIMLPSEY